MQKTREKDKKWKSLAFRKNSKEGKENINALVIKLRVIKS